MLIKIRLILLIFISNQDEYHKKDQSNQKTLIDGRHPKYSESSTGKISKNT